MDHSFAPYDRKYRACCGCCHVKTFTVIVVFIELVVLLITVCSEIVSRHLRKAYCVEYEDDIKVDDLRLSNDNESVNYQLILIETACVAKPFAVGWSALQAIMAVLVLLGIRCSKWYLLVPHLFFQAIFLLVMWLVCVVMILAAVLLAFSTEESLGFILLCVLYGAIWGLAGGIYTYVFVCILRSCQYIKREAEFIAAEQEMHMGTISAQYATLPYEPHKYTAPDEFRPINLKDKNNQSHIPYMTE